MDEELYYAGNIGYRINTPWRGHSYAYDASLLMMQQARDVYHMDSLLITCSPDNPASKRTLQKLSGTLLETVDVPAWHWLYKRGETVKEIYRYQLI
jgi:predicted acetyltransferase